MVDEERLPYENQRSFEVRVVPVSTIVSFAARDYLHPH